MKRLLQKFDFRSSSYSRPNQTWICGRQSEGSPCRIGPGADGSCRANFECQPVKRDDRWHCTRSDLAGGQCQHGPFPDGICCKPVARCRPVMNWRARPGAAAWRVAALTFGLLLVLVAGGGGPAFINPGPLTSQHVGLKDCKSCHTAFDKGPTAWVHAAFAEKTDIADSKRCLTCHDLGGDSFQPHGLSPSRVAELTRDANPPSMGSWAMISASAAMALKPLKGIESPLPCLSCHREHHGAKFDLKAMADANCQFCHMSQFPSLENGHPEFDRFPFKRRTRIRFDHLNHISKHFRDKEMQSSAPKACKSCHLPDEDGFKMLLKSFEDNCGACHGGQVEGVGRATAKGLPVFNVPGLDVETLSERNIAIGEWPEDADEEITPFMEFLLAGDGDYMANRKALAGLDLLDLADASPEQLAAVESFAWRVKELIFDVAVEGMPALMTRLEKILGKPLSTQELTHLSGLLPVDTMRMAAHQWVPDLYREVANYRQGSGEKGPSSAGNDSGDKGGDKDGGLLTDEKGGDGLLTDEKGGDGLLTDEKGGDGLLTDEKGGDGLLTDEKGGDGLLTDEKEGKSAKSGEPATAPEDFRDEPENLATGEDWSMAGGWYRDEFTLRYRPTGHADRFLRAWLDVIGQAAPLSREVTTRQIFESLASDKSPGLCTKCHSIDTDTDGRLSVNWQGARMAPGEHPFTVFSHTSHFSLPGDKGCLTCHTFNKGAKYLDSFKDRNPATFASNFEQIPRQLCAGCHTAAEAGESCLTCHNYHIGKIIPALSSTLEMMSVPGAP